ncbi:hypothetical protein NDU88_005978 [Pleurodeles waltl]|uniref:Uncharacterized protein n=1 Tax=Pleurodeles waltl TaxID=8319 RepID=A0AAV7QMX2_PLEWA|nr:hypothetical protein NDU88_005978 [Pleurodeles waltl]
MCRNSNDVARSSCGPRTMHTQAASRCPAGPHTRAAPDRARKSGLASSESHSQPRRSPAYQISTVGSEKQRGPWQCRTASTRHSLRSLPDQCSTFLLLPALPDIMAVVSGTQCSQEHAQHHAYQEVRAWS